MATNTTAISTIRQFEKRYLTTLRRHLGEPVRTRVRSPGRSAKLLAGAAVSLGLDTLALARVHDRTLVALASAQPDRGGRDDQKAASGRKRADRFFLQFSPLVGQARPAQAARLQARRLDEKLRAGASMLAKVRGQASREIKRRKQVEKQLAQADRHYSRLLAQSRRLARQVLSAQEEERREISRELHDEVAQILAGINVHLAALQDSVTINRRTLRQRISKTQRLVGQSVRLVHRYAREIRPAMLDDLGLIPALRSYIKNLPGRKGLRVRFTAFPGVEILDNARRTVLYRVAQEALTNVARHAHARCVKVSVRKIADTVRLEIRDDGKSFRPDRVFSSGNHKHLGLLGMRERVEMVDGHFAIDSQPGRGTVVRADIPIRGQPEGSKP